MKCIVCKDYINYNNYAEHENICSVKCELKYWKYRRGDEE